MANFSFHRRLRFAHRPLQRLTPASIREILRRRKKPTPPKPREWISWKLGKPVLRSLLVTDFLLMAVMIFFLIRSSSRDGFAVIGSPSLGRKFNLKRSLLWTSLPGFLLQIYVLCIAAVVEAFGFRQPFIELNRGAKAKKSITVEYRSYFAPVAIFEAFSRRHWHLSFAFTTSLVSSIALSSLAAHLVVEHGTFQRENNIPFQQDHDFYNTSSIYSSLGWDLSPVLEFTSASLLYGGSYPKWSNGTHTFRNFSMITPLSANTTQGLMSVDTNAYFAELDCEAMSDSQYDIERRDDRWFLNGTQHGCNWTTNLEISEGFRTYLRTSSKVDCGAYKNSNYTGRLVIVGASNVDFNTTLPTVVSCVPTYWTAKGKLSVSLDQSARDPLIAFSSDDPRELRPQWWNSFEEQLNQVTSIDTTDLGGTAADSVTTLGRIMLDRARRIDSNNPLSTDALMQSVQQTFVTAYSILVEIYMIRPAATTPISGEILFAVQKLFVDNVIAGIVLGFLSAAATLLALVYHYTYAEAHSSMLFEEPVGLLGYAGVLCGSVVNKIAAAIRETPRYRGKTVKDGTSILEKGLRIPDFFADPAVDANRNPPDGARRIRIAVRLDALQESEDRFIERIFPPQGAVSAFQVQPNDEAAGSTSDLLNIPTAPVVHDASDGSVELRERHAQRPELGSVLSDPSQASSQPRGSDAEHSQGTRA